MILRTSNRRIRLLLALSLLVFAGTLARAVWLQAVQAGTLDRLALRQQVETIVIPAGRGTIYDRTGKPLAIGEQATTVFADPRLVKQPRRVAIAAARTLGVDPNELFPLLSDRRRRFVYIARKVDAKRAAALESLNLDGVEFYAEELRAYPQRSVAAHVLGFADIDNKGLEGLERSLDRELAGRQGSETVVKDALGRAVDVLSTTKERPGRDVQLTLDSRIQAHAESVLRDSVREARALGGTAIVLDPATGAVLAMATAPSFDANRFAAVAPARRRNRAVTDTYEPGSTFKVVSIAAALAEGIVTPRTAFKLDDSIQVADRIIREHAPRPTQRMTVSRIIAESSNIGTITIAQRLGEAGLKKWIDRFGFGTATGVDVAGESMGILPGYWSGSTIGNVPIGQGIAVTGLQMAAVYAAIANGGVWRRPHLVARVGADPYRPSPGRRVISPVVSAQMMAMLRGVVDAEGGTGTAASVPGYTVAGKTGTAAKPDRGGYSTSKYVASFVGVVPAKRPRLVVLVSIDEPRTAIWGGVVAAPAFSRIAQYGLQELEVAPDALTHR
ncbi:MAG: penicillin-binding protein 2 [Gaiellaceae bacterium MAG52_C11]|nr:penicillin-binding protein 2 [Candidatus Gaiellasilicea maunaloa]